MSRRIVIVLAVAIIGIVAWYAFRPERLFMDQKVNEQFPNGAAAASNTLAKGQFHSGAHETKGTATVFQLADGKKMLRLTDFATSNGPDVHVYLVAADDAKDNDTVKYRAVSIWCKRFSVNFGAAPLMNDSMQSMNQ